MVKLFIIWVCEFSKLHQAKETNQKLCDEEFVIMLRTCGEVV
jgi:hypothetical protein